MAAKEEYRKQYLVLNILLVVSALLLLAGSIYIIKTYALYFGVGIGSYTQGQNDGANTVEVYATELSILHQGMLEAYALTIIALIGFCVAALMFLRTYDWHGTPTSRKYSTQFLAILFIYVVLLYVVISPNYTFFRYRYLVAIYCAIAIGFIGGIALEYINRLPTGVKGAERMKSNITIDPSKPFSNVIDLQDELFGKMSGHMKIVDKHFNSSALANFHRLMDNDITNFTKITILSSKEMLDSDFTTNLADFRNELNEAGVALEVRLMDEKDAVAQHERMLMDDKVAYKVPPFNIINKRSEHITKIGFNDAQKRFTQIYARAIKLENYAVKQARGENPPQDTVPKA